MSRRGAGLDRRGSLTLVAVLEVTGGGGLVGDEEAWALLMHSPHSGTGRLAHSAECAAPRSSCY